MTQACLQHVYRDTLTHKAYDPSLGTLTPIQANYVRLIKTSGARPLRSQTRGDKLAGIHDPNFNLTQVLGWTQIT